MPHSRRGDRTVSCRFRPPWRPPGATLLAVVVLAGGCGDPLTADYSRLDLLDVSGTVTLDGEPLPGAMVIFEAGDQTYSYGQTDEAGRFSLMFNSEKSGVLPGPKIVRITMGPADEESGTESDEGDHSPAPPAPGGFQRDTTRNPS